MSRPVPKTVAIAGATGVVGKEMLKILEERDFPISKLILLASANSTGKTMKFKGEEIVVQKLTNQSFENVDIALFSAGGGISKKFAPYVRGAECIMIDNSSAFRLEGNVPLVVPEINPDDVREHEGIIANPNCTTIISLMALAPLHEAFGLKSIVASSYQAVSGSGAAGLKELERQTKEVAMGMDPTNEEYPYPIINNLLPLIGKVDETGFSEEERKMRNEGSKILHLPNFKAATTCVRVPVPCAHTVSISASFTYPVSVEQACEALKAAEGISVVDSPNTNSYPMPYHQSGEDNCAVGRIRIDENFENGLAFVVCGDQLRKGAALNTVQIAELLI